MAPIVKSTTKQHHEKAPRPHNASRRESTHQREILDVCLHNLSDELNTFMNDARELCEIKMEPDVSYTFWGTSAEPKSNIIADRGLSEIMLETAALNMNEMFCGTPTFEYQNSYSPTTAIMSPVQSSPSYTETSRSPYNPVSNVLNYHLHDLGEPEPCGQKLDTKKPKVNALLWRIQEAMRIEKMSENETTEISEIDKVLRCRSDIPDIDETCEITINPNLARHPAAQRRELQHQLYRMHNNKAAKACRMIRNANKAYLLNDVYEMQKNYERLTRRWAMEKAVSAFLDETLANVRADAASTL